MVSRDTFKCEICAAKFDLEYVLDAHTKGHSDALAKADSIKKEIVSINPDFNLLFLISMFSLPWLGYQLMILTKTSVFCFSTAMKTTREIQEISILTFPRLQKTKTIQIIQLFNSSKMKRNHAVVQTKSYVLKSSFSFT